MRYLTHLRSMRSMKRAWHLPLGYLGFFLPAGVLLSYLPPFLRDKGLAAHEVGWIFSAVFGIKLLTGPLLAWWADALRRQSSLSWAAAWVALGGAWLLATSTRFTGLLLGVLAIAACRNYFQSLLEALATRLKDADGGARYGSMRALGSTSVCIGVLLFGGLWSAGSAWQQAALPLMLIVSALVLLVCLHGTQAAVQQMVHAPVAARAVGHRHPSLRTASGLVLLAGATLLIGANGVFYSSATLLLQQHGTSDPVIAALWCTAFGIEALGFAAFDRLRARWGNARLFAVVVGLALLRWSLLAADGELPWLLAGFALHLASFSWTHALCALWVRDLSGGRYAITGQAVYTACAHGIGMAGAAWFASRALPSWGSGVYGIAATMTAAGATLVATRAVLAQRARTIAAVQA